MVCPNNDGFLARNAGNGRDWFLVKAKETRSGVFSEGIDLKVFLPKHLIGRKVKFKLVVLEED